MYILSYELFFVLVCIIAAFVERKWFKENKSFKHWWGITIYLILVGIVFLITKNLILCLAALLIGEVIFSPFLNLIRGNSFFYTNVTDPNGSVLDRIEGKTQKILYFASLLGLIILQIIFFK